MEKGWKDNNKKTPGDTEAVIPPGPSRTSQQPGPLCISPLAHGPLPERGRGCRTEDRRRSVLPDLPCPAALSDPPARRRPGTRDNTEPPRRGWGGSGGMDAPAAVAAEEEAKSTRGQPRDASGPK